MHKNMGVRREIVGTEGNSLFFRKNDFSWFNSDYIKYQTIFFHSEAQIHDNLPVNSNVNYLLH